MADGTKIEWTDATWNPIRASRFVPLEDAADPGDFGEQRLGWHCEHASEGCRNCYAERMNLRGIGTGLPYKPGHRRDVTIFINDKQLLEPLRWKRPRKIFPCSMTDLFADFVTDEMIDRIFAVMALCPQHVFQVLTKRSVRMREYLSRPGVEVRIGLQALELCCHAQATNSSSALGKGVQIKGSDINPGALVNWPLPNVWLGVSVEDQRAADERIPDLLATPAAVRWLSCEPLLGRIDFEGMCNGAYFYNPLTGHRYHDAPEGVFGASDFNGRKLDWIVAGGESGPGARPMFLPHVQSLRDQCASADVPFLMKQWGEWVPAGQDRACHGALIREFGYDHDAQHRYHRVGKKAAGRLLDGVLHDGYPA